MNAADLIITNAHILTMDDSKPRASAIASKDGRIIAVGTSDQIRALCDRTTEVIDAHGATLLPGFVESHCHLFMGGAELSHLQLGGMTGFDAVSRAIRDFASTAPLRPMLMAQGAAYLIFDRPATRHDLDRILPDRPFAMASPDHHTMWANTAALAAAGILQGCKTPAGSEVVVDADGTATGELREPPAFAMVAALTGEARSVLGLTTGGEPAPAPTAVERRADREILARALGHLAQHGITSAINMDGNLYTLELLRELQCEGRLTARVKVAFHMKPFIELSALDKAEAMAKAWGGEWLSSGFVKMFMDGVIDNGTAFMLNDYPGKPGWRGEPLFDPTQFARIAVEADRRGLQIAVHAIGDAAVRAVLDGYETAERTNGRRESRHRIEHIELIDPADMPRLGRLGVVSSVQPLHLPGAVDIPLEPTAALIPRDRWKGAYLWRSLVKAGAAIAFGSDWPVANISPLVGIRAALSRKPWADGLQDERIGLMATLAAYTRGGAFAAHCDHVVGVLRVGMLADMVLLSDDIETVAADDMADLSVAATISGGRVVYRA